jgi:hypothetical protein
MLCAATLVSGCQILKCPNGDNAVDGISLFDGRKLGKWKVTKFGGEGEVKVKEDSIYLDVGYDMTGVTWKGDLPARSNYEISWEAMREEGGDFFCALTFPVDDANCSLVAGGWGGTVVGISSINSFDASENESSCFHEFINKRWYRFKVRVTDKHVICWIDDKELITVERLDKKFSVRPEVELNQPLGFSSWQSAGRIRDIVWKNL